MCLNKYLSLGRIVSYNAWPTTGPFESQGSYRAPLDTYVGFARYTEQILPWSHTTGKVGFQNVKQQSRGQIPPFLMPCPQLMHTSVLHFRPQIYSLVAHARPQPWGSAVKFWAMWSLFI